MRFLVLLAFLSFSTPVWAQESNSDTHEAQVFAQGSGLEEDTTGGISLEEAPLAPSMAKSTTPKMEIPVSKDETLDTVDSFVQAVKNRQWLPALGFGLMILIYVFRTFKLGQMIPSKYVPWVTLGVGCFGSFAVVIASGGTFWTALWSGFVVSSSAALLWSTLGKAFLPKAKGKKSK